ncbi:hypothetical protein Q4I30_000777, partial [Leishmania utingensis]
MHVSSRYGASARRLRRLCDVVLQRTTAAVGLTTTPHPSSPAIISAASFSRASPGELFDHREAHEIISKAPPDARIHTLSSALLCSLALTAVYVRLPPPSPLSEEDGHPPLRRVVPRLSYSLPPFPPPLHVRRGQADDRLPTGGTAGRAAGCRRTGLGWRCVGKARAGRAPLGSPDSRA